MLVSLGGATKPAYTELQKLGIITKDGTNLFYDQAGNIKPLAQVYQILQNHTKKLNNEQRLAALRTIFNNRALAAASILTRSGAKGFEKMNKEIHKTTAAEVASKRLNNLSGDLKKLKTNFEVLFIRGGSPFQKQARQWVQSLTRLLKAFGNLSPKQQKMIIQMIGMTGALLVAMGIFNLIIGGIIKFVANIIQMAAAISFVVKWLRIIIFNLRWLVILFGGELAAALGISVGLLLAIVAVIALVVVAAVILYKKWAPFRKLVNTIASAIWDAIKAFGKFVATIVKGAPQAWNSLVKGVKGTWNSVKNFFTGLINGVKNWFSHLGQNIRNFVKDVGHAITSTINWFKQLPGRALKIVGDFVSKVFSLLTFRNLGFVIGYAVGFVIRVFYQLGKNIIKTTVSMVKAVVNWFKTMGPRVWNALQALQVRAVNAMVRLAVRIGKAARNAYNSVINWFKKLPGRVANYVTNLVARAVNTFNRVRTALPRIASQTYNSVVNWFQKLPGRVGAFVQRMVQTAVQKMQHLAQSAQRFGDGIYNGIITGIQGLPGAVQGILGQVISAIKGVITQGFNAVRDFASGLWHGFKKGLGINSPSFIEKAMWKITGVMDEETRRMAKHTMKVQALSRQLAMTGWNNGDYDASSRAGIMQLASMHARNRDRLRSVAGNSGKRRVRIESGRSSKNAGPKRHEMHITNWREGKGYMKEVADDAIDDQNSFDLTVSGMDY
jgi:phage-related protein